jgi:hypothetical protein
MQLTRADRCADKQRRSISNPKTHELIMPVSNIFGPGRQIDIAVFKSDQSSPIGKKSFRERLCNWLHIRYRHENRLYTLTLQIPKNVRLKFIPFKAKIIEKDNKANTIDMDNYRGRVLNLSEDKAKLLTKKIAGYIKVNYPDELASARHNDHNYRLVRTMLEPAINYTLPPEDNHLLKHLKHDLKLFRDAAYFPMLKLRHEGLVGYGYRYELMDKIDEQIKITISLAKKARTTNCLQDRAMYCGKIRNKFDDMLGTFMQHGMSFKIVSHSDMLNNSFLNLNSITNEENITIYLLDIKWNNLKGYKPVDIFSFHGT